MDREPRKFWMTTLGYRLPASILACVVASSTPAQAQQADLFFDTVDVNVVNIEVIVTDKDGTPITGLTRDDFSVLEDGRPVELSNFMEVVEGQVIDGQAPDIGGEAVGLAPSPRTQRLQLVIFVDNQNLRPESRKLIFTNLREYIENQLEPDDLVMMVVANDSVEVAQPFTNDPQQLLVALDRLKKQVGRRAQYDAEYRILMRQIQSASLALPGQGQLASNFGIDLAVGEAERLAQDIAVLAERRFQRVRATTEALAEFTDTLAGMRGRKAVLYVSDGLPVRTAESLVEAWLGKYESWIQQANQQRLLRQLTSLISLDFDASSDLRRLVATANANRVAFYPLATQLRRGGSRVSAEVQGSPGSGGSGPVSAAVIQTENFNLESSLLQLAEGTGGLAYTRSTNIGGLLGEMKRDFTSFYSLGYVRPSAEEEEQGGDVHRLKVKVRGDGLKVRHLKGYSERSPLERLEDQTLTALYYGIEENPLGVRLEAGEQVLSGKNKFEVAVTVMIPFQELLLLPQGPSHAGQVTLLVVARGVSGGVSGFQRVELPIRIPNEQMAEALRGAAAYPMRLKMTRGRQRISVGVRDHLARVDSILNLEVEVGGESLSEDAASDQG